MIEETIMTHKKSLLKEVINSIENGSRPKGGVKGIRNGVPSVGAEHLDSNGGFDFSKIKFIPTDFYDSLKRGKIVYEDVLIVKDGATTGKTSFINKDFPHREAAVNEHVFIIRANKNKALPEFLFFFIYSKHGQIQIQKNFHGSAQGGINTTFVDNFWIPVPPITEQRRIVNILHKVQQLKLKREKANQMANKVLQAVFFQMFGDKSSNTTIGNVSVFVSSGSTPLGGKKTYLPEGVLFIRSQNVLMNQLKLETAAHISEKTHKNMGRTWVKDGDVLLNITGASLGRVASYKGEDDKANVNQHVCIIRLDKSQALPEYIAFFLSTPNAQKEIWTIQAGASRQALNFKQVKSLKLYLPPLEKQKVFVSILTQINNLIEKQKKSSNEIQALFNSLMSKAFKGELVSEFHLKNKIREKMSTHESTILQRRNGD